MHQPESDERPAIRRSNKLFSNHRKESSMLSRRTILMTAAAACAAMMPSAFAASPRPFDAQAFADAQKAGKPILVAIHASWCPTCKAQAPILNELRADPKFKNLAYLV